MESHRSIRIRESMTQERKRSARQSERRRHVPPTRPFALVTGQIALRLRSRCILGVYVDAQDGAGKHGIRCDCGWEMHGDDADGLVAAARRHARELHKMEVPDDVLRQRIDETRPTDAHGSAPSGPPLS